MDRSGIFQYRNDSGEIGETQIINNIHQRKDKPSSQDIIVPLVKHLVDDLKGKIEVVSKPGEGAVFTVAIPNV